MLHHEGASRRIGLRRLNFKRCAENTLFHSTSHDRLKSAVKRSEKGQSERDQGRGTSFHTQGVCVPHQRAGGSAAWWIRLREKQPIDDLAIDPAVFTLELEPRNTSSQHQKHLS